MNSDQLFCFLFRHMRVFVFIALFGSTYVAFYMVADSIQHGFANADEAAVRQPTSIADIFQVGPLHPWEILASTFCRLCHL